MEAIARFHMRLDSNIISPRDFKCFKRQLFLPLHNFTSEEFYDAEKQ